jgi:prepilin-type N-terminal cleavage/methylation domain-containing protein
MRLAASTSRLRSHQKALTLVEMLVTMSIFGIVVLGMVQLHLFGLSQNQIVESKLGASDQSRMAFGQMLNDVRSAKLWRVGNVVGTNFVPIAAGTPQRGTALLIYQTTNTVPFIQYHFETNNGARLLRTSSLVGTTLVVNDLTNTMFFQAEDHRGIVKTDISYRYAIRILMEFYQYRYPKTTIGQGYLYDYYKMEFKVTPHSPAGS